MEDSKSNDSPSLDFLGAADGLKSKADVFGMLVDHMLNGLAYCRMVFENGHPQDFIYLYTNPAFHAQTGLGEVTGRLVSQVIPGIRESNQDLLEMFGRVVRSGKPEIFETFIQELGRWFSVSVYSPHSEHFVAVFDEITDRKRIEANLKGALAEAQRFRDALDRVPAYIYMKDRQHRYVYANRRTLELFGCTANELAGSDDTRFFPPSAVKRLREVDSRVFSGECTSEEIDIADAPGGRRVYWEVKAPIYQDAEQTTISGLYGISTDITESKRMEQVLRESEARFSLFMNTLPAAAFIKDKDGAILYANRYMEDVLGVRDWRDKTTRDLFPPELAEEMIADDRRALDQEEVVTEEQVPCTDGQSRLYQTHKFRIPRQGQPPLLGGIALDITERKQMEEKIWNLAYFDPLTNLPNRRMLFDHLAHGLSQAKRYERSLAVMFLDLDNFKKINDTLGHDVGDKLLKEVSVRLNTCVRTGDTVSRAGGDEFIIVLPEITHPDDAALVADKIIKEVNIPVQIDNNTINVSTSIGIAVYPVNGSDDSVELMKKADKAMYAAKAAGRNGYRFFAG